MATDLVFGNREDRSSQFNSPAKSFRHPGSRTVAVFWMAIVVSFATGCGPSTDDSNPKETQPEGQLGRSAIPEMLHGKQIQFGGNTWTLSRKRFLVKQIQFHSVTERSKSGTYTATLSCPFKTSGGHRVAKLKVTYRINKIKSKNGKIDIETYPVSKVETISVTKYDPEDYPQ